MSLRKIGVVACATSIVLGGCLLACVGDSNSPNIFVDTDGSAADGATSASDGSTPLTDSGNQTDAGTNNVDATFDAGPTACQSYCATMLTTCGGTASPDGYPNAATCLGICATMLDAGGVLTNSLPCRIAFLEDGGDCVAAGPWAYNPNTGNICGLDEPCVTTCTAAEPMCNAQDASLGDCQTACDNLINVHGSPAATCMETEALAMYADASPTNIAASCAAFLKCK